MKKTVVCKLKDRAEKTDCQNHMALLKMVCEGKRCHSNHSRDGLLWPQFWDSLRLMFWESPADEGGSVQCSDAKYHLGEREANRTERAGSRHCGSDYNSKVFHGKRTLMWRYNARRWSWGAGVVLWQKENAADCPTFPRTASGFH